MKITGKIGGNNDLRDSRMVHLKSVLAAFCPCIVAIFAVFGLLPAYFWAVLFLEKMKKTKIFYLEDEPFLGKIVRESLESRDFEVRWVADGREAAAAFEVFAPDICVLDVMLPHLDGFAVGQAIRQRNPGVPIIFLTAKTQTADVLEGFAAGGNDYIRKPFSMEELIVRIKNLLQISVIPAPKSGDDLIFGQFSFSPVRQELVFGQTVRRLSHRESELLKMLATQPGQLVERKEILDKIWGNDSFFNSRNLDVYITRLREYLRAGGVEILTLKGVGYRLLV